jgi:hypothetical protein
LLGSLGATVTATYQSDSNPYFTKGSSLPFDSDDFILHLGTLTFHSSDGKLYDPSLTNITVPNSVDIVGPMTWYSNSSGAVYTDDSISNSRVMAVYTNPKTGSKETNEIWGNAVTWPITDINGNLNTTSFVVDFYLVSYQTSDHYKPGGTYTLNPAPPIGEFNVAVADNGSGIYSSSTAVSLNGSTTTKVPLLSSGITSIEYTDAGSSSDEIYLFSILDNDEFSVSDAIGSASTKVATAQLSISNGTTGETYAVTVTFSDSGNNQTFELKLDGTDEDHTIPYYLEFLGQQVLGGDPIDWDTLHAGTNEEDIKVTGINSYDEEQALSGTYQDTITVTVIPEDTV